MSGEGGATVYRFKQASFPGLPTQLLSLTVRKMGGRPGWTYHVMHAAADITFSLLTSGFVLSPFTLLSLNSVRSFCSVCPASPIATGLIVASYSTWRQLRHTSRDKSVQAFPCFSQATRAWRPGNEARFKHCRVKLCTASRVWTTSVVLKPSQLELPQVSLVSVPQFDNTLKSKKKKEKRNREGLVCFITWVTLGGHSVNVGWVGPILGLAGPGLVSCPHHFFPFKIPLPFKFSSPSFP